DRLHRRSASVRLCRRTAVILVPGPRHPHLDGPSRHRARGAAGAGRGAEMIGMVLVTHGRLAAELLAALEHVVGPQESARAISIGADDDMEQRRQDIIQATEAVDTGAGVILLTDMFGGTPSNLAISILDGARIEV